MTDTAYGIDQRSGLQDLVVAYAQDRLPILEGVSPRDMPCRRTGKHGVNSDYADSRCGVTCHSLSLTHPEYGVYYCTVTVEGGRLSAAAWAYDGEACEVGGVVYGSRRESHRIRKILVDAGLSGCYPGCREAVAAIRKANGVEVLVGERWGCGMEHGTVVAVRNRSITIEAGGKQTTLPLHVVSKSGRNPDLIIS